MFVEVVFITVFKLEFGFYSFVLNVALVNTSIFMYRTYRGLIVTTFISQCSYLTIVLHQVLDFQLQPDSIVQNHRNIRQFNLNNSCKMFSKLGTDHANKFNALPDRKINLLI